MAARNVTKVLVLLLLVLLLLAASIFWFDYLNLIDIRTLIAPVYRLPFVERMTGTAARSQPAIGNDDFLDIDAERLAVRLEALRLQESELDRQKSGLDEKQNEIEQTAAALAERERSLNDQERAVREAREAAESYDKNVEVVAGNLNSMRPDDAVNILVNLDDQFAIDILRKTDALAAASGTASLTSVWLSRLPPERAATLQRKMAARP
jgi:flagellar protein FlbB